MPGLESPGYGRRRCGATVAGIFQPRRSRMTKAVLFGHSDFVISNSPPPYVGGYKKGREAKRLPPFG